jgi:hypothetical protein
MKNKYYLLLFLLAMILPATGYAQGRATAIDTLIVDLWPDYDRASVLVLLTGTLSADTKLPATVIFPVPVTAQLNAVARIDSSDGVMKDDILSARPPADSGSLPPICVLGWNTIFLMWSITTGAPLTLPG